MYDLRRKLRLLSISHKMHKLSITQGTQPRRDLLKLQLVLISQRQSRRDLYAVPTAMYFVHCSDHVHCLCCSAQLSKRGLSTLPPQSVLRHCFQDLHELHNRMHFLQQQYSVR